MSMRAAALKAGISPSRWKQIESGTRQFRGETYPEPPGPAPTVARMAHAVGATPEQMEEAGRPDVAGELRAILDALDGAAPFTGRQKDALASRISRNLAP